MWRTSYTTERMALGAWGSVNLSHLFTRHQPKFCLFSARREMWILNNRGMTLTWIIHWLFLLRCSSMSMELFKNSPCLPSSKWVLDSPRSWGIGVKAVMKRGQEEVAPHPSYTISSTRWLSSSHFPIRPLYAIEESFSYAGNYSVRWSFTWTLSCLI